MELISIHEDIIQFTRIVDYFSFEKLKSKNTLNAQLNYFNV